MTIEEMKDRKDELGYTYEEVAALSGVPIATVQKIFGGFTKSPRYETMQALERALGHKQINYLDDAYRRSIVLHDPSVAYGSGGPKAPGEKYTRAERDAFPDDFRTELIDGELFICEAPSVVHQMIQTQLISKIDRFIESNNGDCMVFGTPTDVCLDRDDDTAVQPDVSVVCDPMNIQKKHIWGAPDLVIEILSPGTSRLDVGKKCMKYLEAGVKEYWLVNPMKRTVVVHYWGEKGAAGEFEENLYIYGFTDDIPVNIYGGKCVIPFAEIYRKIERLLEE